jgi:hypothetical protein
MINERSRRLDTFRAEFCEGVKLADGQTWYLPKPWVEICPTFENGAAVDYSRALTVGPDLEVLVDAVRSNEGVAAILAIMTLGAFLLRRNYELTDAELETLFVYRDGDSESDAMLRGIVDTATGLHGPKRSRAGAA